MLQTMLILLRLSMTPQPPEQMVPVPTAEDLKAIQSGNVTHIDASGSDEPESDLPAIVKKGPL